MSVIATDTQRLGNLVKKTDSDFFPFYTDVLTAREASLSSYPVGTVLGKITASGKYIISKTGAVDGSQVPAAIYIGDSTGSPVTLSVAATTDTPILALTRGKIVVSKSALTLDAGWVGTEATVYAALKAIGIFVETTV